MQANLLHAPHIRHQESTRAMMIDITLALVALYAIAFYYYGQRVIALGCISVAAAVLADVISLLLMRKRIHIRDLSAVITGLILPLLMPAAVDFHVPVVAALFAIFVAKAPFGGFGHNVFNPAAAGFGFAAICFPVQMFSYTVPLAHLPMTIVREDLMLATSPALSLKAGGIPQFDTIEMLLGNFAGPLGATNIIVLLACLLYLVFRGTLRWEMPVFFLLTTAILSLWFPRVQTSGIDSLLYEMMSGMLLFGAVFMLGDPVTSPKRDLTKIAYAIIAGCIVMLFRHIGNLEEGFIYALLLMNATVWGFDMIAESIAGYVRRKKPPSLLE